jgi:serine/threonine-protein kinase RsbW
MMDIKQERAYQNAALAPGPQEPWRRTTVQSPDETYLVLDKLAAEMNLLDYPRRDALAVRLALDEAITNAIKHGHGGDPSKRVRVSYLVTVEHVVAEVEDEGPGFDPQRIPDPRTDEGRERPGGRGVFLMRASMTWVQFSARGNRVVLCRQRSG